MVDDNTLQKKSIQKHSPQQPKPKKRILRKGTTTCHITKSLKAVMDALDRYSKKGFHSHG